jgi:hypothetical protein
VADVATLGPECPNGLVSGGLKRFVASDFELADDPFARDRDEAHPASADRSEVILDPLGKAVFVWCAEPRRIKLYVVVCCFETT